MRLIIEPTYDAVSRWAANYVVSCINKFKPTEDKPFVLGLPTGSSPLGMYKHLIELNRKGVVSFRNVVTFNMDEYCNLPEDHEQSYHTFMWSNFFSHIDIRPENVNILNGNAADPEEECARYEAKIASYGRIVRQGNSNPEVEIYRYVTDLRRRYPSCSQNGSHRRCRYYHVGPECPYHR